MTLDAGLVAIGALGVAVVLASRAIRHLPVTEPLAALLLGVVVGPEVLGIADFDHGTALLHSVSELVMAVALMAIALRFPWPDVAAVRRPLAWMLLAGMAGMAVVVALLGAWALGLGAGAAVLVGGVLAPTDPVLATSVVTGDPAEEALPGRLRLLLSVESGANDGLALPIVVAGLAMVHGDGPGRVALEGLLAVGIALVVGAVVGDLTGRAFAALDDAHDIEDSAFFVFTLVLGFFVLGLTNLAGGDGILGVFVAGLAYNRVVGQRTYEAERENDEGINRVLILPAFALFGVILPWSAWADLGWRGAAFTLGVLLLRRLPVVFALAPVLGLDRRQLVFYGWFGPMGVAALFYVTLALEDQVRVPELWPAVSLVVAASTVVHGMTAAPGRWLYQRSGAPARQPGGERVNDRAGG